MNAEISVVIPAYNEGENIVSVLERLKTILEASSYPYEIIVINDGSSDGTGRKANNCGARVINHRKNLGYGRSLKDGILAAMGKFILLTDADGTYDADEVPQMLRLAENSDMVVGHRIFAHRSRHRFKNITRRFFAYFVSYYLNAKVKDLNSGQRVFLKRDVINRLNDFPDGFSFTSTMTARYIAEGKKITYVPVKYRHRDNGSKFISSLHIPAIAKLAFSQTLKIRPVKFSAQVGCAAIVALFSSMRMGSTLGAGLIGDLVLFAAFGFLLFTAFLCYIYFMGKRIALKESQAA